MKKYMTKQRKELLCFLEENADAMFKVYDIYDSLKDKDISLSAVYRNLPVLEKEGLINRIAITGSSEIYYQSIDSKLCKKSIHLNCTKCGKSEHLKTETALILKDSTLTGNGFELDPSKTVIYGKCSDCQENN